MEYTPGPWKVDGSIVVTDYEPDHDRTYGYGCGNNFIADLNDGEYHEYYDYYEQKANTHLIATAPEMYELLEKVLHYLKSGKEIENEDSLTGDIELQGGDWYWSLVNGIDRLLQKARGESERD